MAASSRPALYRVRLLGAAIASAEIEEIVWLDPTEIHQIELAPLTRDFVLPLVKAQTC
jgi:8-oxo-dGTP diphosphatase